MRIPDLFIECEDCDFVLLSVSESDPEPKRVDACPDCGGTDFRFTQSESAPTDPPPD